ncbi:MAG: hypothetical protein IKT27_01390 [Clostridia bacterium]|nr:hypothetical protein [Clostridia bacterium]
MINTIENFILSLDPIVRAMITGLLVIIGILCFVKVIKAYVNAKSYSNLKILPVIFTIIFIFLAVWVASI